MHTHVHILRLHQMIKSYERKLERFSDKIYCSSKNFLALVSKNTWHAEKSHQLKYCTSIQSNLPVQFWTRRKQFSQAWECLCPNPTRRDSKLTGYQESAILGLETLEGHQGPSALLLLDQVLSVPAPKQGSAASKEHWSRTHSEAQRVTSPVSLGPRTGNRVRDVSSLSLKPTQQAG